MGERPTSDGSSVMKTKPRPTDQEIFRRRGCIALHFATPYYTHLFEPMGYDLIDFTFTRSKQ